MCQDSKERCVDNNLSLSFTGSKHQDHNPFVERVHSNASRMARIMLMRAHLPRNFILLAYYYVCEQLRVLSAKNLITVIRLLLSYIQFHRRKILELVVLKSLAVHMCSSTMMWFRLFSML